MIRLSHEQSTALAKYELAKKEYEEAKKECLQLNCKHDDFYQELAQYVFDVCQSYFGVNLSTRSKSRDLTIPRHITRYMMWLSGVTHKRIAELTLCCNTSSRDSRDWVMDCIACGSSDLQVEPHVTNLSKLIYK